MTTAIILAIDGDHADDGQHICEVLHAKFPGVHFLAVVGLRSSVVFDYDGPEPTAVPARVRQPTPTPAQSAVA